MRRTSRLLLPQAGNLKPLWKNGGVKVYAPRSIGSWVVLFWLLAGLRAFAQTNPAAAPPQDPLMQLMLSQPAIEISTNVEILAAFDPPVIGVGEPATYRVTINAISDSIKWPEDIYAPLELNLKQSARGQVFQSAKNQLTPVTTFNHRVTVTKPGTYTIPAFRVKVAGRNFVVPAARLEVSAEANPAAALRPQLYIELSETNAFCGQRIDVRLMLPSGRSNVIQSLTQVQINGDGVMVDQGSVRQRIQPLTVQGRTGPVFIYEATFTPLVAGRIDLSAQGFTAGGMFGGPITIQGQATILGGQPQYILVDSDTVRLDVEPLPRTGLLPGFSGAIGQFDLEAARLETNRVRVGDPVKLFVTFRTQGDIKRLNAPEPPAVTNWQMLSPVAEGGPALITTAVGLASGRSFSYTMIPFTNNITATPEIPFCYFDPDQKKYIDLTIPSVPIQVVAGGASAEAQALAQAAAAMTNEHKLQLSGLAPARGKTTDSLVPFQVRRSFWLAQLLPLFGFAGWWYWDRRRRFYERHPEVLVRRRARQALRRERRVLTKAARANDAAGFARSAVAALRVAGAPHFPALPRALVGRDILELFAVDERDGRTGAVIQQVFAVTDAAQFSASQGELSGLLALQPELERILDQLEERLR